MNTRRRVLLLAAGASMLISVSAAGQEAARSTMTAQQIDAVIETVPMALRPHALAAETQAVLELAPPSQVRWASDFAARQTGPVGRSAIDRAVAQAFPDDPAGMRAQTSLLAAIAVSGNVLSAAAVNERLGARSRSGEDFNEFSRSVLNKLGAVRRARSRVIRNFAANRPPRAYEGSDEIAQARGQDRAQRYTQFVQLSTQLMGELQNSERELVDVLQTMKRDLDNHWQAYASMRDSDFRTSERIMTIR